MSPKKMKAEADRMYFETIRVFIEFEKKMGSDHPAVLAMRRELEPLYALPPKKFH